LQITVYTGNKRDAGTDAQVYVIMHGKNSSSPQIHLSEGTFGKQSIDRFTADVPVDLSPLTALDMIIVELDLHGI
jgi:hypothetical protein